MINGLLKFLLALIIVIPIFFLPAWVPVVMFLLGGTLEQIGLSFLLSLLLWLFSIVIMVKHDKDNF